MGCMLPIDFLVLSLLAGASLIGALDLFNRMLFILTCGTLLVMEALGLRDAAVRLWHQRQSLVCATLLLVVLLPKLVVDAFITEADSLRGFTLE